VSSPAVDRYRRAQADTPTPPAGARIPAAVNPVTPKEPAMSETIDRRTDRIRARAEEGRLNRDAQIERDARARQHAIDQQRAKLALRQEKSAAKRTAKEERRASRRHARQQISERVKSLLPTVGRRAMIAGPILAPMTVAWIGQISFAMETLGWIFLGALVFAAAWELTTAFTGWMYHQARKDGDRGTLFRVATWIFASSAGAMNYWHALPDGGSIHHPTPKAVSYGSMSLVGIGLWELYSYLIHRKHLRAAGKIAEPRPSFGILRWVRFPRITWTAWSLSVRYGIKTVDEAWSAAVAEIARRDRAKAVAAERKRIAKDRRPAVRLVVATAVARPVAGPKTRVRLFWTDGTATTLSASTRAPAGDYPDVTNPRQVDATTKPGGRVAIEASGRNHTDDRRPAPTQPLVATAEGDHPGNRTRPAKKSTQKTGRAPVGATAKTPTAQDNALAVALVKQAVADGRPLSKRALAKRFGFSPSWALKRIQEAGPRPVGGGRRASDHSDATAPKDHPATSEVMGR
jgi:hypothetical protein